MTRRAGRRRALLITGPPLRLVLLAMGAVPIPASLPVSKVETSFTEDGPTDDSFGLRAVRFLDALLWWTTAARRMGGRG